MLTTGHLNESHLPMYELGVGGGGGDLFEGGLLAGDYDCNIC